jgi:hypothetical protein
MSTADSMWARNPRKPLPTPTFTPPQPTGTLYAAGSRVGSDLTGHYVCIRPTTSQPPAASGQSNDCWAWSATAAVVDGAQTPLAHP